jgi:lipopolysaccharide heptosyltransferase II
VSGRGRYHNYSRGARVIAGMLDLAFRPLEPLLKLAAPRGEAPPVPRSILVVRLDHLGDLLMTTPAIAALRRTFPDARIDLLAAPWGRGIVEGNPHLDRVLEAAAPWYDPRKGELPRVEEILRVSARLRREPYDWAFDMRGDPRVVLFHLLPAARRRFGFSGLGLSRLLTDALPYDRRRPPLDLSLDLARMSGARPSPGAAGRRPVLAVGAEARARAAGLLGAAGLPPDAEFVVVAPGSNRPNARWGIPRFARLCDGLQDRGLRVLLSGGPADAPITSEVASLSRHPVEDLAGRLPLADLAALLERALLLVTNDSGASHVGAAVGCPTVAIFGPTDPALTFPYEDGRLFQSVAEPIDHPRPCFDPACDSDHGLARLSPERVLEACLRVESAARGGRPVRGDAGPGIEGARISGST